MAAAEKPGYVPPGRFWSRGSNKAPRPVRHCRVCEADISGLNGNARKCKACALDDIRTPLARRPKMVRLCSVCNADISRRGPKARMCKVHAKEHHARCMREYNAKVRERTRQENGDLGCEYCAGMAHAREPGRMAWIPRVGEMPVANDKGECNGCGLPYVPLPPIERGPLIHSSIMGDCKKHYGR